MTDITKGNRAGALPWAEYQSPPGLKQAALLQRELAQQVRLNDDFGRLQHVVGLDVSHNRGSDLIYAAAAVLSFPELRVLEVATAEAIAPLPYRPGFLAFREVPALLMALAKLEHPIDLMLLDGQGVAHPRGLGIAAHLGVITGLPAIGSAKSRLVGDFDHLPEAIGERVPLMFHGRLVGYVLKTRKRALPIYVSAGHRVSHETATNLILAMCEGYRLPAPVREAHRFANRARTTAAK